MYLKDFIHNFVSVVKRTGGRGEEPGAVISGGHSLLQLQQQMQRRAAKVLWSNGKKMTDNTELVQRN